jgi:hypothetical protein
VTSWRSDPIQPEARAISAISARSGPCGMSNVSSPVRSIRRTMSATYSGWCQVNNLSHRTDRTCGPAEHAGDRGLRVRPVHARVTEFNEPALVGDPHQLGAVPGPKFREQSADVGLCCRAKPPSDPATPKPLGA